MCSKAKRLDIKQRVLAQQAEEDLAKILEKTRYSPQLKQKILEVGVSCYADGLKDMREEIGKFS